MLGRVSAACRVVAPVGACAALGLLLANCSGKVDPYYGVSASPRVVSYGDTVPKGGGVYRVGAPYTVAGRVYVPEENPSYRADGLASWYGEDFHGRQTANGEVFDLNGISAAHPTLPLPCYARVTNLSNGRSIIVRVNDRGPYHGNRIIDVSVRTSQLLGFQNNGTAWVRVEYAGRAPLVGSDDRVLASTLRQDEPAPSPNSVKLADAKPFVPSTLTPVERGPRLASMSANDAAAETIPVRRASFVAPLHPTGGAEQVLYGRGLY
ncbi:MAG TPA: septal ring lytic transglycosylase RlpA family protein [Xanthobacteraceae bacterium]|jgi:rare lipoprotein A|nr:septal ring lytic transglycosylase RlpA family protein [Xanthobacteraceae bacterium]